MKAKRERILQAIRLTVGAQAFRNRDKPVKWDSMSDGIDRFNTNHNTAIEIVKAIDDAGFTIVRKAGS